MGQRDEKGARLADKGLGDAVTVHTTRFFPIRLPVLLLVGTVPGTLAFGAEPAQAAVLASGCLLALLGAAIGGFVYNAKRVRPAAAVGRIDVLLSLESHEQKHLRSQVLGKVPLEPEHLVVARGAAVQMRKGLATQLVLAPIYPLAFIPQAVNFIGRGDAVIGWVMAAFVGALFIGLGLLIRDFRRTGAFLERTAASPEAEIRRYEDRLRPFRAGRALDKTVARPPDRLEFQRA